MSNNNDGTMVVTYSTLESAALSIERQAKQLDTDLGVIKQLVASVSELWEGEAKEAYRSAQTRWDAEARGIHDALADISRRVRDAAPAYQAGDKRARAGFE